LHSILKSALIFAIFCWTGSAHATVFLEDMTWMELRDAISSGATTIIIPIGGTEQNGPAMALGKHNARVKVMAEKIAVSLGHTIVAPVMAYVPEGNIDPPTAHMKFPGTLTVPDAVFNQVLESTAKSLKHAGFKNIVLIGDHGSYQSNEVAVAAKLNKLWAGSGTKAMAGVQYYSLTQGAYVDALNAKGHPKSETGTHAALADTALELATAPHMVRVGKLQDGTKFSADVGVYGGDPRNATSDLGQLGVDLIVAGTVSAIQDFLKKN
jgi:creatinine amidohydrolase